MILVQIGLYLTIVLQLFQIKNDLIPIFTSETWDMLTSEGSELYHPLWKSTIIFEAIVIVLMLCFAVYALIMLDRKKSQLPKLMIIFYSLNFVIIFFDTLLIAQIPLMVELEGAGLWKDVFRTAVTCGIWIPFFIKSERVKNTFIN